MRRTLLPALRGRPSAARLFSSPSTPVLSSTRSTSTPTSSIRPYSSAFQQHPSPPRLPPEQQAEFERLQRAASSHIAPESPPSSSPSPYEQPLSTSRHVSSPSSADSTANAGAGDKVGNLNDGVWRGAPAEFEGDTNPKTGEVGGPKNEPLRWGSGGDWSYNGKVTDF